MGNTLTISLLMNKTCILNFLNEFWERFDQGSIYRGLDERTPEIDIQSAAMTMVNEPKSFFPLSTSDLPYV